MIEEIAHWIAETVGVAGVPIGIVVSLLVAAYHGKHLLELGRALGTIVRIGLALALVLAVLFATPAVEIDVSAGVALVEDAVAVGRYLAGLTEVVG